MNNSPAFQFFPNDWLLSAERPRRIRELGFDLNATEFIVWSLGLSCQELGEVVEKIRLASLRGDAEFIRQFPFVGRIYTGRMTARREYLPIATRRAILAAGRCARCGRTSQLTVDHIKPYSKGGTHAIENLQCLCWPCNLEKSDREDWQ